jgi:hypothetical protein
MAVNDGSRKGLHSWIEECCIDKARKREIINEI